MGCRLCQGSTWPGWQQDLYHALGGPTQLPAVGVQFLSDWQQSETGGSPAPDFNPLAVANSGGGTNDFNSSGVMNYPSPATGAKQTAGRIRSGYPAIFRAIHDGDFNAANVKAMVPELRRWGSVNFANKIAGGKQGTVAPTEGAGAADWTSFDLQSLWSGITDWLSAVIAVAKFFLWLLQPKHFVQLLEVVVGVTLTAIGLWLLAKAGGGGKGAVSGAARGVEKATAPVAEALPARRITRAVGPSQGAARGRL